ncbi:MAG: hypothetical protein QOJ70_1704, partial [Acidobacteriota bacterium]|nr:hypothetical protein [Acidobacteriota bacterium]
GGLNTADAAPHFYRAMPSAYAPMSNPAPLKGLV